MVAKHLRQHVFTTDRTTIRLIPAAADASTADGGALTYYYADADVPMIRLFNHKLDQTTNTPGIRGVKSMYTDRRVQSAQEILDYVTTVLKTDLELDSITIPPIDPTLPTPPPVQHPTPAPQIQ